MLLTGRYSARTGVGIVISDSSVGELAEFSDPEFSTEPTLAEFLKAQGYRTMMCGKYHLGQPTLEMDPGGSFTNHGTIGWWGPTQVCGFDVFRGHFRNLNQKPEPSTGSPSKGYYNYYWFESDNVLSQPGQNVGAGEHATRKQRGQIQNWIRFGAKDGSGPATEPWFVYWATSVVHSPYGNAASPASGCAVPDIAGTPAVQGLAAWLYTAGYATQWPYPSVWSAIENLAYELEYLKIKLGDDVWDRTVFILMGDNGADDLVMDDFLHGTYTGVRHDIAGGTDYLGVGYEAIINNVRMKATLYGAGTRVPLIISGPDWIVRNKNRFSYALVDAVDVHATIRRIARASYSDAVFDSRGIDGQHVYDILAGVTGADAAHRTWSLSERFTPCGNIDAVGTEYGYTYRKLRSDGIWHLIQSYGVAAELYHTQDATFLITSNIDTCEQTNLAGSQPTVLAELQADYAALIATMKNDHWPTT